MAQKIYDKKIEGPALKTVDGYLYHTYLLGRVNQWITNFKL